VSIDVMVQEMNLFLKMKFIVVNYAKSQWDEFVKNLPIGFEIRLNKFICLYLFL